MKPLRYISIEDRTGFKAINLIKIDPVQHNATGMWKELSIHIYNRGQSNLRYVIIFEYRTKKTASAERLHLPLQSVTRWNTSGGGRKRLPTRQSV